MGKNVSGDTKSIKSFRKIRINQFSRQQKCLIIFFNDEDLSNVIFVLKVNKMKSVYTLSH